MTDIKFSSDGSKLYSASASKHVMEWNIEVPTLVVRPTSGLTARRRLPCAQDGNIERQFRGDNNGTSVLALCSRRNLLAAARTTVRLIDLESGQRVQKFAVGHAGAISCIAFCASGDYLATASTESRLINVFDCSGSDNAILQTLSLLSGPTSLSFHSSGANAGNRVCTVVACCELGDVAFFRFSASARELAEGETGAGVCMRIVPSCLQ